jgi:hypothetical protein
MDQREFFAEATEAQRYKLTEVIGKGSYGVVASAVDQFTGAFVGSQGRLNCVLCTLLEPPVPAWLKALIRVSRWQAGVAAPVALSCSVAEGHSSEAPKAHLALSAPPCRRESGDQEDHQRV